MAIHFAAGPTVYSYGDINAIDGTAALTICLWHYQTAAENTGGAGGVSVGIIGKDNQAASPILFFKNESGGAVHKAFGFTDGTNNAYTANDLILDDTWQNLAYTYDGSQSVGSRANFFIGGASVSKASDTASATIASNASSVFVGSIGGVIAGWNGTLAHVKVWTAVLTPAEVLIEAKYAEPQRIANLQLYIPLTFNAAPGATWDGTNTLVTTTGTPTTGTVGEPPVRWPAGAQVYRNSPRRVEHAERRDRFQRLGPKRPLVQYG